MDSGGLRRDLGLPAAVAVVVGSMIGVGVFLGPRVVAQSLDTPVLVLLAWALGGLFVFCGALSYAELGASLPQSGGPYAYMREAYGPLPAYLTGWSGFAVGKAASVATLAVAFAEFLPPLASAVAPALVPPGSSATRLGTLAVALTLIAVLTLVNVRGVRAAGRLAVATMWVKVGVLLALVLGGLLLAGGRLPDLLTGPVLPAGTGFMEIASLFGLALLPVFFAYDGWVNSTQVGEEVVDPARNVPRSLILGTLAVVALYALVNLAYLLALGPERVGETGAAANTATALFGDAGGALVLAGILVSIVGTINAVILSGPRIAYAMARDGLFPRAVERVSRFGTPAFSIVLQGVIAAALVLLPPVRGAPVFDTLLTYIIVDSFIFYGLGAAAVFVLRRKRPDLPRPYRVPFYPWVPLVFVAGSALFVLNMLVTKPLESLAGMAIVLAGLPGYWYWRRAHAPRRLRRVSWIVRDAPSDDEAPLTPR